MKLPTVLVGGNSANTWPQLFQKMPQGVLRVEVEPEWEKAENFNFPEPVLLDCSDDGLAMRTIWGFKVKREQWSELWLKTTAQPTTRGAKTGDENQPLCADYSTWSYRTWGMGGLPKILIHYEWPSNQFRVGGPGSRQFDQKDLFSLQPCCSNFFFFFRSNPFWGSDQVYGFPSPEKCSFVSINNFRGFRTSLPPPPGNNPWNPPLNHHIAKGML